MATYKDSVGNTYDRLPKAPPQHKAKSTHSAPVPRRSKKQRAGKYARYRALKGRPNGPGQPGNKSGKNKSR